MSRVSYELGCRSCLSFGRGNYFLFIDDEEAEILNVETEFSMVKFIENWRMTNGLKCEFCQSENVEILNAKLDGCLLYDHDALCKHCDESGDEMFQINIEKQNGRIITKTGGSEFVDRFFLKEAFREVREIIESRPEPHFEYKSVGNTFVCLTGSLDANSFRPYAIVQRFRTAGITKEELSLSLDSLLSDFEL